MFCTIHLHEISRTGDSGVMEIGDEEKLGQRGSRMPLNRNQSSFVDDKNFLKLDFDIG